MDEITFQEGIQIAFTALVNDRLAMLAGAGLSMAPPSLLPSTAEIAATAKRKYDSIYGAMRAPLSSNIEEQAEFFFQNGELDTVFFRTLIDRNAFAGRPNDGHSAMADLLLIGAIQTGITTNVDSLIELAGQLLLGQIGFGIDRNAVAALPPDTSPLLKIHGCRSCDPANMVWAPSQLKASPVAERIASSRDWLLTRLIDRDLLIVGFWTDWDYLNAVLEMTLGSIHPARVIVVNPEASSLLPAKAPELHALGNRATSGFKHVRARGEEFLSALRLEFSKSFVRQVLHFGSEVFAELHGAPADSSWLELSALDNDTLWRIRRDLEGRLPQEPAKDRRPSQEPLVGLTLLQLQAGGAVLDGAYWMCAGQRVRVLRAANKPLHLVEAQFQRESAPATAPNIVIAVGAEETWLPSSIARTAPLGTIARGGKTKWMTRTEGLKELGL
jgi:hypothetical protein